MTAEGTLSLENAFCHHCTELCIAQARTTTLAGGKKGLTDRLTVGLIADSDVYMQWKRVRVCDRYLPLHAGVIPWPALNTGCMELDPITHEEAQTHSAQLEGPSVRLSINNPFLFWPL